MMMGAARKSATSAKRSAAAERAIMPSLPAVRGSESPTSARLTSTRKIAIAAAKGMFDW